TFWGAIGTVVVADAVMGLDNALAIAGAAAGNWPLIIFGLAISVPIIIYGSTYIQKILNKYPDAIYIGSFVLFVVAFQMITTEPFVHDYWWDALDEFTEKVIPFLAAMLLTAKQYYRMRIRS
ncbi:MAG: TerC family protein, partial [Candidatus Nanopelagicales bacterium]